ncbi:hypothetical protein SPV1_12872, partial [Mariprofundus ferrooxydans PV-1]
MPGCIKQRARKPDRRRTSSDGALCSETGRRSMPAMGVPVVEAFQVCGGCH